MRRIVAGGGLLAVLALEGCGASLPLPFEIPKGRGIPPDGSYQMIDTWTEADGMHGIRDILITQGPGSQLFMLFNHGGIGLAPRGEVRAYPFTRPQPITSIAFPGLFNPVALAAGAGHVFVLDEGDTCLARAEPGAGTCNVPGWNNRVSNLAAYWRVRQFGLLGMRLPSDTSSFTDTTLAFVQGIAADDQGRVYVSGTAIVLNVDPNDSRFRTRLFQYRVYRYVRGPRYPGVTPADRNMPGSDWHRDTTFVVEEGSGLGTLIDPRGLFWSPAGGGALYAADFGKNLVQKLSDDFPSTGFLQIDGGQTGNLFRGPVDVAVDLSGFIYALDAGTRRVLRYDAAGDYIQTVNVELDEQGDSLANPITVAVDDTLVYVGDATLRKVIRYNRRT
jgi:hypothetical protein